MHYRIDSIIHYCSVLVKLFLCCILANKIIDQDETPSSTIAVAVKHLGEGTTETEQSNLLLFRKTKQVIALVNDRNFFHTTLINGLLFCHCWQ